MRGPLPDKPDFNFIDQLKLALEKLGFTEVFVDTAEIKAGDDFEGRIHSAILNCDLFIPLIGRDWLALLLERRNDDEPDILVRELTTAFRLEKEIAPLLIDDAAMPPRGELDDLEPIAAIDAKQVDSRAPVEAIVEALKSAAQQASGVRRLGAWWTAGYSLAALMIWIICGIVTNAVGMHEYGSDAWEGMATSWAGMFIWPFFFLPFILLALYRPFRILLEAILNAGSVSDAVKFAIPLLLGTVIALGGTLNEISDPQVPWTIHPGLSADCTSGPAESPPAPQSMTQYDQNRRTLFAYGDGGSVSPQFQNEFWMRDKCWPNVFFYIVAATSGTFVANDRAPVQDAFLQMIAKDSKGFKRTDAPYSTLFPFYALAFFLMSWLLATAILMAIIYAAVSIRRARDGKILRIPNEDAFLCLTYGFITLLVWIPFRITTNYIKFLYDCANPNPLTCQPAAELFNKDFFLGLALLLGYVALTVGLLWNYRRLLLGFIGTIAVFLIAGSVFAATRYHDTISQLTGYWQFWLTASLIASMLLVALWFQFDPAIVRLKDFQESARPKRDRKVPPPDV